MNEFKGYEETMNVNIKNTDPVKVEIENADKASGCLTSIFFMVLIFQALCLIKIADRLVELKQVIQSGIQQEVAK